MLGSKDEPNLHAKSAIRNPTLKDFPVSYVYIDEGFFKIMQKN